MQDFELWNKLERKCILKPNFALKQNFFLLLKH